MAFRMSQITYLKCFFDIALTTFAAFHGNFRENFFLKLLKMELSSFHLIEQAPEMSKITLSVIVYAPCPNKTIIKTKKKQMNCSADTFF